MKPRKRKKDGGVEWPEVIYRMEGDKVTIREIPSVNLKYTREDLEEAIATIERSELLYSTRALYLSHLGKFQGALAYLDAHTAPPASATSGETEEE